MSRNLDDFDEPTRQVAPLLPLTGSERLHLVQGSPWKAALGAFMADGPDAGYWSAPRGYKRGDLLLTVLNTQPRMPPDTCQRLADHVWRGVFAPSGMSSHLTILIRRGQITGVAGPQQLRSGGGVQCRCTPGRRHTFVANKKEQPAGLP